MNIIPCPNCGGTGYVYTGSGSMLDEDNYDNCRTCDGYGVIDDQLPEELDPELR